MIVAIDGPAGSGKSTVARAVAAQRGLTFLDTGAMYRAVTVRCQRNDVDVEDAEAVAAQAAEARISFAPLADGSQGVFLDGDDVTQDIRTPETDANVSVVSAVMPEKSSVSASVGRARLDQLDALDMSSSPVPLGVPLPIHLPPEADLTSR